MLRTPLRMTNFSKLRMTFIFKLRMTFIFKSDGQDVHGGGVGAYGGGVDPGVGLLDGVVVDEVAGFEVVGSIED